MLERPFDFWDSWSITLNLTVLDRGLLSIQRQKLTCTDQWWRYHLPSHRSRESSEQGCCDVSFRNYRVSSTLHFLPSVLLDVTQVVTADNDGALHLGGDDQSLQDGSTNGHIGSERALLVHVLSVDGSGGGLDAQTNVGVPALVGLLAQEVDLAVRELILLLESSLVLQ